MFLNRLTLSHFVPLKYTIVYIKDSPTRYVIIGIYLLLCLCCLLPADYHNIIPLPKLRENYKNNLELLTIMVSFYVFITLPR